MKLGQKVIFDSQILRREVHLDVFEPDDPTITLLLFGGTGIDEAEYTRRRSSVIPLFNSSTPIDLNQLRLVYATAPFDVPFVRFDEFPDELSKWNRHVREEILGRWKTTPFLVGSFSGSAALVLNGIEQNERCVGGVVIAPDDIKSDFVSPKHWPDKLAVFTSPNDRVCSDLENRNTIQLLVEAGEAIEIEVRATEHQLLHYFCQKPFLDWLRMSGC